MSGSSFMMSRVRVAMILHGALMMGVMAFGGIMAMLARAPGRSPGMVMNPPYLAELLAWGACSLGIAPMRKGVAGSPIRRLTSKSAPSPPPHCPCLVVSQGPKTRWQHVFT